jgi:hypothetical protein
MHLSLCDRFKEPVIDVCVLSRGSPLVLGRKPSLIESTGRAVAAQPPARATRSPSAGVDGQWSSTILSVARAGWRPPPVTATYWPDATGMGEIAVGRLINVSDHVAIF